MVNTALGVNTGAESGTLAYTPEQLVNNTLSSLKGRLNRLYELENDLYKIWGFEQDIYDFFMCEGACEDDCVEADYYNNN